MYKKQKAKKPAGVALPHNRFLKLLSQATLCTNWQKMNYWSITHSIEDLLLSVRPRATDNQYLAYNEPVEKNDYILVTIIIAVSAFYNF